MIIDDVIITASGGKGGNGSMKFSSTKRTLGPTGGSGGRGGDILVEGVSDLGALRQFRYRKQVEALNGKNGKYKGNDGQNGVELILPIPVGTVVHNLDTNDSFEIIRIGQLERIARGGRGGRGNYLFRSATNTTPKQFEEGKPGETFRIRFELKLIADVGFIGLPNVGKSSLLNELTNANSKVANYAFTTLEPNLGVYYDLILGDIPGIIEGAAEGKGLGHKFLQHIERTKVLFHLVSAESADPVADYKTIRNELGLYKKSLLEKPEYIFLSKSDEVSEERIKEIQKAFKKLKKEIVPLSIADDAKMESVKKILNQLIEEKNAGVVQIAT
jgi:GTP-binding protein